MIYEVFGLPRSGKTTFLTMIAQRALRLQASPLCNKVYDNVYTNFECLGCKKIDFDALPYFDFSNSLIIIDEMSLYADNRKYKSFSDDMLYFFKLHGHYKLDVVWCSQNINDADKKIRDITDIIFYLKPCCIFGKFVSTYQQIQHNFDFNNRTVTDCYDIVPMSKRLFFRPKWYKFFDSYSCKELPSYKSEKWFLPSTPSTTYKSGGLNLPYKVYSLCLSNLAKLNLSKKPFTKTIKLCKITKEE